MFANFNANTLVHLSQEMAAFVDQLIERLANQRDAQTRRAEKRHAVAISVHATPLDAKLRSIGQGFTATTRDISQRGMILIHYKKVHAPFLAVELTDAVAGHFQSIVQVLRCRAVGPYFEMTGRFVTKVNDAPKRQEASDQPLRHAKGTDRQLQPLSPLLASI